MTSSGKGVLLSVAVHAVILVGAVLLSRFVRAKTLELQENAPIEIEVFEESIAAEDPAEESRDEKTDPSVPAKAELPQPAEDVHESVEEAGEEPLEPVIPEVESAERETVAEPEPQSRQEPEASISVALEADRGTERQTVAAVTVQEEKTAVPVAVIRPKYPPSARRRGIEGDVVLEASVDANGTVVSVTIRGSSGNKALDDAAVDAMRKARFQPAEKNGGKVPSTVVQTLSFRLR